MIAMTTNNSTSVKPRRRRRLLWEMDISRLRKKVESKKRTNGNCRPLDPSLTNFSPALLKEKIIFGIFSQFCLSSTTPLLVALWRLGSRTEGSFQNGGVRCSIQVLLSVSIAVSVDSPSKGIVWVTPEGQKICNWPLVLVPIPKHNVRSLVQ